MKIACMQPYFIPYMGYWQLLNYVDKFVILDDVQYITKGWINRNKISLNKKDFWLTIPLNNANKNKIINEIHIDNQNIIIRKILRTIELNFIKSENGDFALKLINPISYTNKLLDYLVHSITELSRFLNIKTELVFSSSINIDSNIKGEKRILEIVSHLGGKNYINPISGASLYSENNFSVNNIKLNFIECDFFENYEYSILNHLLISDKCSIINKLNNFKIV